MTRLPVASCVSLLSTFAIAAGVSLAAGMAMPLTSDAGPIYRCENSAGVVEYSNAPPSGAAARACQTVELPNITTIPGPARTPVQSATATPSTAARSTSDTGSAAGFPKVSNASQKARDEDRARILGDELQRETEHLDRLRAAFNNGEPERQGNERNYQKYLDRVEQMRTDIARHEGNVEALRRELGDAQH